ncbi:MAG: glutamate--tRNA ligase, partial [Nanoarchaeota archaeon]|nr:glutamate--tRNA ligase [Nanoarchaeota archaeon]
RGFRHFTTHRSFYVTKEDHDRFAEGELVRFMDCLNFRVDGKKYHFDSLEHEKFKGKGKQIIQWLPKSDNLVNVEVRMPDNTYRKGLAEPAVKDLHIGDSVQFTRFGFCRLDEIKEDKLVFWFTTR